MSVQRFLKLEEASELLNSLDSDESDVEIVLCFHQMSGAEDEGDENEVNTGEACIKRILSSRLVSIEWDNRNRWCDGQVCPEVGQGIMVPWCVLCIWVRTNRTRRSRERLWWPANEKGRGACCVPAPGV
ncbi:hypothetical protein TNCV_1869391 [Trichonephila clavipes]|nr:hypothetical protein TNCV_1869391 [Trichonephila clavipes]